MLDRFKVPEEDRVYVRESEVRAATEAIFLAIGLVEADAKRAADVLIQNDLRGTLRGIPSVRAQIEGQQSIFGGRGRPITVNVQGPEPTRLKIAAARVLEVDYMWAEGNRDRRPT